MLPPSLRSAEKESRGKNLSRLRTEHQDRAFSIKSLQQRPDENDSVAVARDARNARVRKYSQYKYTLGLMP